MKGSKDFSDAGKETVKEVDAAEKTLQLHLGRRPRHRSDRLNLGGKWHNAGRVHKMAQVLDGRSSKDTFFLVEMEHGVTEAAKNAV